MNYSFGKFKRETFFKEKLYVYLKRQQGDFVVTANMKLALEFIFADEEKKVFTGI